MIALMFCSFFHFVKMTPMASCRFGFTVSSALGTAFSKTTRTEKLPSLLYHISPDMSTYVFNIRTTAVYDIQRGDNLYHATLDPVIVGSVIADFRKKKGISQEVLSGLADIGRTHLSAIERGERKPTLETLYRIATALNVNMSDILLAVEEKLK